ncbi:hypothetical protein, variant 1 [Aphanomyces astaci]|uniref:Tetratrico peptide repeat group 5 domain-containing protein n=1 Tax=Aphanomyces astaci TaxID=112090 RepID=W4HDI6_APHAT|nr:hypothetical protein, variant 1 [Aphanomyces astaci]ETV89379.1 hypothetical protein, variant 1 [Aphanomyces astaci]|eukprot:XP_009821779.1 hypothetical protein, variant 1 [Aphanomyces astaci]
MRIYIHVDPSGGYSEWTYVCKTPLTHVHEAVTAFVDAYNCKFPTQQLTPSLLVAMANNKPLEPTKKISTLLDDHDSCELALVHVATSPPPQPVVTSVEPRKPNHGAVDMLLGHANKHRQNNAWRSAKALWEAVLVDMDTANASAMQGMVDLYMQSTQWTKAKSVLLKLLLADPTHQAPRLQLATCEMHLANSGRAITILQELLSTPSLTPDMDHDASILLATALYECGSIKDQDKAVSILVHLLDKSNHTDMDAMALYSQVAHDRGKPAQAMQMMLKVLVDRPKDKRVQAKCAAFLEAPRGFEYLQLALDPTSPSTAPAYAYLASVAKDHGAMTACVSCFQQAVAQCPSDVMFALNYVHALEVCGRYGDAFVVVKQFVHNTPTTVVGMDLTCQDIAAVLAPYSTLDDASGHWTEEAAMAWKGTHVCVYHNDAKFERAVATTVDLTGQQLDLLALLCTLVKILFLQGCLRPVPALVDAIEPLRYHYGHLLHTTSIRNEHAYYSCITQLVTIPSLHVPRPRPSNIIYVCGDSHALATAWRSVGAHVLVPALVTGLKHWHLRKTSTFYPKVHFFNVIKSIPRGATVVFVFGEIDCREGLLVAVEKCRYETLEEGMAHTMSIFMDVVEDLVREFGFKAFIHPIVPVLDETRHIVQLYNRLFQAKVQGSTLCHWMDFFDSLLTPYNKLQPSYVLDGTHLHPSYLSLWATTLEPHMSAI